jgi:outer membrane protein assembly factor BamD
MKVHRMFHRARFLLTVLGLAAAAACATVNKGVPAGTSLPDKYLFDKGTEALQKKKWLIAQEYFRQIVDTYTKSPYRPDAKLGSGDAYLGEGTPDGLEHALSEFTEFLSFFPTSPRADYAQYKLGIVHFRQMLGPQRDQTQTRLAVKEFETFVTRYPDSELMAEGKAKLREARDRLSDSDYQVGFFYFRQRWYPGAVDRFKSLLKDDPEYTNRDAVYYYLAESLIKVNQKAAAVPYYEKLIDEFQRSEYLANANKRIAELKSQEAKS